jgi:hypothetical protein
MFEESPVQRLLAEVSTLLPSTLSLPLLARLTAETVERAQRRSRFVIGGPADRDGLEEGR